MIVNTKNQVIQILKTHQKKLKQLGVSKLGLFGSFVNGKVNKESDLDVFVLFETEQKTFRNFMDLSFFLEDLFERNVDLVTPESLSPHFGEKILQEVEYVSFL